MSSEHSGASPEDPAKDSTLLQEAEAKNPGPSAAMRAAADPAAHDVQEELRNCFPELEMEIDLFPNDADADADADTGDHDTDDDDDGDADEDEGDEGGGVDGDADEEPVDTSLWAGLQHNDPGICGIQWTRTHVKCNPPPPPRPPRPPRLPAAPPATPCAACVVRWRAGSASRKVLDC